VYQAHFQLTANPFSPSSVPGFIYPSAQLEEVLAHFGYALEMEEAFLLLTGEVGTGKTTAVQALLENQLRNEPVAVLSHTTLTPRELLDEIARRFGLETRDHEPKPALIHRLEQFFAGAAREGRRAVLFLDEAHLLTPAVLEEVRLLSNLRCEGKPPLLICLVGQPELAKRLKGPRLRQLRQRISVRYAFEPLTRDETRNYLAHRLQAAGSPGASEVFAPEAADVIYDGTRGVPREINVLAGQAMLNAYLEGARQVARAHVVATRSDYGFEGLGGSTGGRDTPDLPLLAMADAPPRDS